MGLIEDVTHAAVLDQSHAPSEGAADRERRIRRGMRLDPKLWARKKTKAGPKILGRATLVAGGIFLGWAGSKLWH